MERTLITYSSVDGHTKTICEKISKQAEKSVVDILPLDADINLNQYKKIIIGASIRYGKYRKDLYNFIEKNKETLELKESAFFSVNAVARKPKKNKPESNPYFIKFLEQTNWIPKKMAVFAGKIDYPKYKFFDKYAIKFIMWITNGPTDTSKSYEFTDWNKVEAFAENLNL